MMYMKDVSGDGGNDGGMEGRDEAEEEVGRGAVFGMGI